MADNSFTYSQLDTSIYALGVGCCKDPFDEAELNFTYSLSDNFKVLPTYPVVLNLGLELFDRLNACPGLPEFNPMMLLHGEQKLEVFSALPHSMSGHGRSIIYDVQDKKSGALIITEGTLTASDGTLLAKGYSKIFIRGIGGFGEAGFVKERIPDLPLRKPDISYSEATSPNQAVIYQLLGDRNPLHVDRTMAALGGFDRPILHGLCTMGFGTRAVLRHFLDYDVEKFRSIFVRFTSHVFPGETLVTDMWRESSRVIFSMKTAERGLQVVQGAIETTLSPESKL